MIRPASMPGVAFGESIDGDPRRDEADRRRFSAAVGITTEWVWLRQVHGATVIRADSPGAVGEADAVFTTVPGLPLAVATADCFPVALVGVGGVGIAHAGWRGAAAGVVAELRRAMASTGVAPHSAAIGPGIGPCCFEVGSEVAARFPGAEAATSWGTTAVDLPRALRTELKGLEVWDSGLCTMSSPGFRSFRRDGTQLRQVAVVWGIAP